MASALKIATLANNSTMLRDRISHNQSRERKKLNEVLFITGIL
jgi:hypothetical protein